MSEPLPTSADAPNPLRPNPDTLPPEAIDLATKLFNFARTGSTAELLAYIDAGVPPNLTNSSGDTILMLAAYHGNADTVSELIARGADVDTLNGRGQSPLAGAVFKGHTEVIEVLYRAGADTGAGHPNALDCANMFKREDVLKLFLESREA